MVLPITLEEYDEYAPEVLMHSDEYKRIRRLIASRDRLNELWRSTLGKAGIERRHQTRDKLKAVGHQIDAIASEVLRREAGIERYMVVRVKRSDEYTCTLQILEFGLMDGFAGYQWAWTLEGRNLRTNGTLGKTSERSSFNEAVVVRRMLNGTWVALRPKVNDET